jgi:hypothetical protein
VIVPTTPAVQPGTANSIVSAATVVLLTAIAPRKLQSFAAAVRAVKAAFSAVVSTRINHSARRNRENNKARTDKMPYAKWFVKPNESSNKLSTCEMILLCKILDFWKLEKIRAQKSNLWTNRC